MAQSISGHLDSAIFEVLAQSGAKRFLVHSGILAAQSKPMEAIIKNTQSQEPPTRTIDLQQWDSATVGRFVEFLYVGHYQAPDPKHLGPESEPVISDSDSDSDGPQDLNTPATAQSVASETAQSDTTETMQPRPPADTLPQFDLELHSLLGDRLNSSPFDPAVHDFADVLFAHARVYFLARDQGVDTLQRLAYQHLLSTLRDIGAVEPGWQVGANIIDLLRYAYSHARGASAELEGLVSQFVALNFPALRGRDEMTGLVREGGELASDLVDRLCGRLVGSESACRAGRQEACALRARIQEEEGRLRSTEAELRSERTKANTLSGQVQSMQMELATSQNRYY
ncbi:hypothetical protein Q9L58_006593 [Maublancomyces gigas]|uniref:BTB domain-containing protein n=1 Tax=Discina gigas TaxID=1032678 RepID=A0ABR3GEZ7_9PEZI